MIYDRIRLLCKIGRIDKGFDDETKIKKSRIQMSSMIRIRNFIL